MENWKDIILIQKWRDGVWQQYVLVLNSMQWLCLIIINTKWAPSKLCHVRHHDRGVKDIPTDKVIMRVIDYQVCLLCCTFINWILFYHRQIPIPLVHNCFIFNLRHVNRRQALRELGSNLSCNIIMKFDTYLMIGKFEGFHFVQRVRKFV